MALFIHEDNMIFSHPTHSPTAINTCSTETSPHTAPCDGAREELSHHPYTLSEDQLIHTAKKIKRVIYHLLIFNILCDRLLSVFLKCFLKKSSWWKHSLTLTPCSTPHSITFILLYFMSITVATQTLFALYQYRCLYFSCQYSDFECLHH